MVAVQAAAFAFSGGSGRGIQWVTSEIYCSVIGFAQPFFSILATIGINLENGFLFAMQTTYPPASGSLSFTLIHSLIIVTSKHHQPPVPVGPGKRLEPINRNPISPCGLLQIAVLYICFDF